MQTVFQFIIEFKKLRLFEHIKNRKKAKTDLFQAFFYT